MSLTSRSATLFGESHPSFFLLLSKDNRRIDVGWLEVPGLSKWKFKDGKAETFVRTTLSAVAMAAKGMPVTKATVEMVMYMIRDALLAARSDGMLVTVPSPIDAVASPIKLGAAIVKAFAPDRCPSLALALALGDKSTEVIHALKCKGVIAREEVDGDMSFLVPERETETTHER